MQVSLSGSMNCQQWQVLGGHEMHAQKEVCSGSMKRRQGKRYPSAVEQVIEKGTASSIISNV